MPQGSRSRRRSSLKVIHIITMVMDCSRFFLKASEAQNIVKTLKHLWYQQTISRDLRIPGFFPSYMEIRDDPKWWSVSRMGAAWIHADLGRLFAKLGPKGTQAKLRRLGAPPTSKPHKLLHSVPRQAGLEVVNGVSVDGHARNWRGGGSSTFHDWWLIDSCLFQSEF